MFMNYRINFVIFLELIKKNCTSIEINFVSHLSKKKIDFFSNKTNTVNLQNSNITLTY